MGTPVVALCKPFFCHLFFLMKRHVKSCSEKKKTLSSSLMKSVELWSGAYVTFDGLHGLHLFASIGCSSQIADALVSVMATPALLPEDQNARTRRVADTRAATQGH
jgi:hypothetical protein